MKFFHSCPTWHFFTKSATFDIFLADPKIFKNQKTMLKMLNGTRIVGLVRKNSTYNGQMAHGYTSPKKAKK